MSVEALVTLESNRQTEIIDEPQVHQETEQNELYVDWDIELTSFVSANQNELVECPWQPGVMMTLSAVTLEWPVDFNANNVDSILSELRQLLASSKNSLLEEDQEDELIIELEEAIEPETKKNLPKEVHELTKKPKDTIKTTSAPLLAPQTVISTVDASVSPATDPIMAAVTEITRSTNPDEYIRANIDPSAESLAMQTPVPRYIVKEQITSEAKEADSKILIFESEPTVAQLPAPLELAPRSKESLKITTSQTPSAIFNEAIIFGAEDEQLPQIPSINEAVTTTLDPEQLHSAVAIQTKEVLIKITDAVHIADAETTNTVHKIIHEIIVIAAKNDDEINFEVSHDKSDLIELYTELLDELEIPYTPEILESLALYTLASRQLPDTAQPEESTLAESTKISDFTGAILRQISATITQINGSILQACALGKSAIFHYNLSYLKTE